MWTYLRYSNYLNDVKKSGEASFYFTLTGEVITCTVFLIWPRTRLSTIGRCWTITTTSSGLFTTPTSLVTYCPVGPCRPATIHLTSTKTRRKRRRRKKRKQVALTSGWEFVWLYYCSVSRESGSIKLWCEVYMKLFIFELRLWVKVKTDHRS